MVAEARRRAAEGHDVVRLDIGEPDLPTPAHIVEAGVAALRAGATRYVAPAGIPPLRAAIADVQRTRGVAATAEQVVVTSGAKPMLLYALLALVQRGDEVLVPDPGYPGYAAAARIAGARVRHYPLARDGAQFRLDVDALRAAVRERTRVLVLNTPQNPTGCVLDDHERLAIAELAEERDLWVVSDEIYDGLRYDDRAASSVAALPGMAARTVVVDGFSKTYAMTGWRLGYGVMPSSLVPAVTALVNESTTCAPAFVQHAGLAALTGPQDDAIAMRELFRARRDALVAGLRGVAGVRAEAPDGAFYVFADVAGLLRAGETCVALADRLLREHDVACIPGAAYGRRGEGMLRLAFTTSEERIREAVTRIRAGGQEGTKRGQEIR
ncbi:aminotransferase class I and II [Gemmatirosa kalamazoonensis]|uniref:Aminotransferase n=2 Tax=Gemmatirosa kalamazoonensis TaxID=861299 RepID=W0RFR4_9BACT|nr:aminotransferase class I and II [Gemmatirosa kalamazoonensis]